MEVGWGVIIEINLKPNRSFHHTVFIIMGDGVTQQCAIGCNNKLTNRRPREAFLVNLFIIWHFAASHVTHTITTLHRDTSLREIIKVKRNIGGSKYYAVTLRGSL